MAEALGCGRLLLTPWCSELSTVTDQFKAYVAGASSRSRPSSGLRTRFWRSRLPILLAPLPTSPERILAYRLGEAFCALQADDEEAAHFASLVIGLSGSATGRRRRSRTSCDLSDSTRHSLS